MKARWCMAGLWILGSSSALWGRATQTWFENGIVAEVKEVKDAGTLPALAARGVTCVALTEGDVGSPQAAEFVEAAHRAGLKAFVSVGFPSGIAQPDAYAATNLLPRLVASRADGWMARGTWSVPLETWTFLRAGLDRVRPGAVFVSDGSRLGHQEKAFDADAAPPWTGTFDAVLKGKKPVAALAELWAFMRQNRPEGARFLRASPHWDAAPIAFSLCLDGVPRFTPGQALAACSAQVLPACAALRREEAAFRAGDLTWLSHDRPDEVAAFLRTDADGRAFACVFNLRRAPVTVKVALPAAPAAAARLSSACRVDASGVYTFSGAGYDIRPLAVAVRPNAERLARARALAAARNVPKGARGLPPVTEKGAAVRPAPAFLKGATMYQLFLRMFTPEGTLKAAEARLPFVKALGVDILYLCPVATADRGTDPAFWSGRQKGSRLGNPCNPYRIADYFGVDPEYGTEQDLKDFVAAAHRLGMKVLFDVVYYHCGPNAVFLKDHPDYIVRNPDGTPKLGDWAFPEMDIANPAVREYLYANMLGFIRDYDVDGFRCDVADMLPVDFWEEGARRCRAAKPGVFFLCEGLKGDDQIAAFDLTYGFYTQWAMVDLLAGKAPASLLETAWRAQVRDYPRGFHWMRCFENHDFANVNPGQKRKEALYGPVRNAAMIATCFLLDGVPMLYNGQEIADARPHSIWGNRDHGGWCIDWSRADDAVARERRALVARLAGLRHAHPALFDAPVVWHAVPEPEKAYAFTRPLPDGATFTLAVNVSADSVSFALPGGRAVTLPPGGFEIRPQAAPRADGPNPANVVNYRHGDCKK